MNSLGNLTEGDFQNPVVAGYKTLRYEGFSLKVPLIIANESTTLPEGLHILSFIKGESDIAVRLFMEGMFKPLSGGSIVKGSVIERWNNADSIRWIQQVPAKQYSMQYGQTLSLSDVGVQITIASDGEVDCNVLLMVCKEWDVLQWELGHG